MADNSSKKFKFISPGVFIDEIDQSQLPAVPTEVGPVVIGRARKGPADKPVQVNSYSDFVQTFGNPVAGKTYTCCNICHGIGRPYCKRNFLSG